MLDNITGILWLLLIISVLVVVHELGHFLAARRFGIRVEDFSIFFGKVLWRVGKWGDTVFNVRAIPFGGFVRIAGMEADDISGGRPVSEALRSAPEEPGTALVRATREAVNGVVDGVNFANVSPALRTRIEAGAGPDGRVSASLLEELRAEAQSPGINEDEARLMAHLLKADAEDSDVALFHRKPFYQRAIVMAAGPFFSLLFAYVVFCGLGMTTGIPRAEQTNQIADVGPGTPAARAGLRTGDRITAVDGRPTADFTALVNAIRPNAGKRLLLEVDRQGERLAFVVEPKAVEVEEGGAKKTIGQIGILPYRELQRYGPIESIKIGTAYTRDTLVMMYRVLLVERKVRDSLSGPVGMAQMTTAYQHLGFVHLALLGASLSLSLGILNLLPIPILDGGHLLLMTIERVRRRRFTMAELQRAQMIGLGIIAMLVIFVMVNDISRLLSGRAVQ